LCPRTPSPTGKRARQAGSVEREALPKLHLRPLKVPHNWVGRRPEGYRREQRSFSEPAQCSPEYLRPGRSSPRAVEIGLSGPPPILEREHPPRQLCVQLGREPGGRLVSIQYIRAFDMTEILKLFELRELAWVVSLSAPSLQPRVRTCTTPTCRRCCRHPWSNSTRSPRCGPGHRAETVASNFHCRLECWSRICF